MYKRLISIVLVALLIPSPAYGASNSKNHYKGYKHTRTYHAPHGKITIYK